MRFTRYKTLYLGTDPPPGVFHYPVIRTEKIDSINLHKALSFSLTHVIFTSKNAVRYWPGEIAGKISIAIGGATAEEVRARGGAPLVAPSATQEGVITLLKTLDLKGAFLLYPRSSLARPLLADYLKRKKIPHYSFDLYDTVFQKPEPVPDLHDFDEIVFTSPSTVQGFVRVFQRIPGRITLTSIGPITKKVLAEYFFS